MEWKNKELENMSEKMRHDSGPACFYRGSGKRKLKKKIGGNKRYIHTHIFNFSNSSDNKGPLSAK